MTNDHRRRGIVVLLLTAMLGLSCRRVQNTVPSLSIEQLVSIRHPSNPVFSPDGNHMAFIWDQSGTENIFLVGAEGGASAVALTHFDGERLGAPFWSKDGTRLYFARKGDLWYVPAAGGEPGPVWQTPAAEADFAFSSDGVNVSFTRAGDVWLRNLENGSEKQLTRGLEAASGPVFSPDGQRIAFTIEHTKPKQQKPDFSGDKLGFSSSTDEGTEVAVASVTGRAVAKIRLAPGMVSAPRWTDATHLIFDRLSSDIRAREIFVADVGSGEARLLYKDVDEKFWSLTYLGAEGLPSPDGRWVAFISDRDGWDRLYVVPTAGGAAVPLSEGQREASDPAWSRDSKSIAFDVNTSDQPGRRQIAVVEIGANPGSVPARVLTNQPGARTYPIWAADGRSLVYQQTDPEDSADLYIINSDGGAGRRLTDSMPKDLDRSRLIGPQLVHYKAPDGASVPAYLFVSPDLNRSAKHPAIIWVHGDGITQNYEGWHVRRDYAVYYSLHQYLAQKGYVVLAIDYRGSIGYGKAWRQGHYRDLGGKDYQDIAAGAEYLKTLDYVDGARLGIWGLSYGGFMALQGLTVTPDLFRCAIDVAGVHDWNYWYDDPGGPWIEGRMGSPKDNPEIYRTSSPINFVDRIQRPLLVLHGTADINVPFLESVHLIDEMIKRGKNVEFMMYPGEFHYFQRAHVLKDAWSRVESFFDRNLSSAFDSGRK